jgi:hypothetical protein
MDSSQGWLLTTSPILGQILNTLAVFHGASDPDDEVKLALSYLSDTQHHTSRSLVEVNVVLGAFCLLNAEVEIQRKILDPVLKFAERDAPTALRLFPVLLATLNYQSDAVKLDVVCCLPKLAVHKVWFPYFCCFE